MNAGRIHEAHVTVETGDVGRKKKTQQSSQETKEHHLKRAKKSTNHDQRPTSESLEKTGFYLCEGPFLHALAPCQAHAPFECTK